jgi:hypothetical protein
MKALKFCLILSVFGFTQAQAQSILSQETFSGGDADWVNYDYNSVTHNASGGRDGGAYISVTEDVSTADPNLYLGAKANFRCANNPSQAPGLSCSGGIFTGDWWVGRGVQELRFWFRHNSTKPGGLQPFVRLATPNNAVGASAFIGSPIPPNTWTQVTLDIDTQNPEFDSQWGALVPSAMVPLRNVGRIQPGWYIDPDGPAYSESNVTFDIDDVELRGTTLIPAVVDQKGTLHPRHNGSASAIAGLNDPFNLFIYGASTAAGDPVNLNTDNIRNTTIRVGQLGGVRQSVLKNQDNDNDGIEDARVTVLTGSTGMNCDFTWSEPKDLVVRAELTTGEIIAGVDTSIKKNCDAQCH